VVETGGGAALLPADDVRRGVAVDELHGVVVDAALAAHRVDRHDVLVVQAGRRPRLVVEALQLPRVHRRRQRQHLQRHPAAKRDLLGLVDDAHAAAPDLADQPAVAQRMRSVEGGTGEWAFEKPLNLRLDPQQTLHALPQRQVVATGAGEIGIAMLAGP
jgi:hypothetical protein